MGNMKALFPIVLSLIIAVAGSFYLYRWIAVKTAPKKIVTIEKVDAVPLVVTKIDLPWGTMITKEMVTTVAFLKESMPSGSFPEPEKVIGRIVIAPMKAGDPVVEHRLASTDVRIGGVSAVIKDGKRAVAVKGDKVIGLSGFINPGNSVDVLVTVGEFTKIVLENVPVLASGTQMQKGPKGEPSPVDVYTLEVSPEDAERLVLAATKGKLQFALRATIDGDRVATRGVTIPQLLRSQAWAGELTPVQVAPKPAPVAEVSKPEKKPVAAPKKAAVKRTVMRRFVAENIRGFARSEKEFDVKETN